MLFTLDRPLIALDLEANSFLPPEQARIVEIGFKILYPDKEAKTWNTLVNPGVPITQEATDKHGITDEHVKDKPTFAQLAGNLAKGFTGADFLGYSIRYDIRVLRAEMEREGVQFSIQGARLLDPLRLWQTIEPRNLDAARTRFLHRDAIQSHRALEDASDALDILFAQLEQHPTLPRDVQLLHDLCFDKDNVDPDGRFRYVDGEIVCQFGKHKGTVIHMIPKGYLSWIVDKSDMSAEVKQLAREAMDWKPLIS